MISLEYLFIEGVDAVLKPRRIPVLRNLSLGPPQSDVAKLADVAPEVVL